MNHYSRLFIDEQAIINNFNFFSKKVKDVMVPIKANAYGLGVSKIVPILLRAGCTSFAVAYIDEGVSLRNFLDSNFNIRAKIFVLNSSALDFDLCKKYHLIPVINSLEDAASCDFEACLHVDTVMNRLGIPWSDYLSNIEFLKSKKWLMVMSHLASADLQDHPSNLLQLNRTKILKENHKFSKISLSNSAGFLLGEDYHFDVVRPGIAMYGINPTFNIKNPFDFSIKVEAKVLQIIDIEAGETVGYGCTFKAGRRTKIATISMGYADGIPWQASTSNSFVMFGSKKAKIIGRVSMDLTTVDVTDIDFVKVGDFATVFSKERPFEDWSIECRTSPYDMCTKLGIRLKPHYIKQDSANIEKISA